MRRMRYICTIAFLLTACGVVNGSGGAATPTPIPTPITPEKPVYTVARGDIAKILETTGRVSSTTQQNLFFLADGYVEAVYVKRGDSVNQGDLLALLDEPEKLDSDIAAAELAVEQAEFDLAQLQLDIPVKISEARLEALKAQTELDKARSKRLALDAPRTNDPLVLAKAEAEYAAAKLAYDEAEEIYAGLSNREESDPERIAALSWLMDARTYMYQKLAVVNWYKGSASPAEIALADAELAVAQAKYDRAAANLSAWDSETGSFELRLAEAKVADAQANLQTALEAKQNIELRAPFAGQIQSVTIAPGDQTTARKAVITLVDPASLEITFIPTPDQAKLLGVGQALIVRLNSQPGKDLIGMISQVPLNSSPATGTTVDNSIHIVLDESNIILTMGELATIVIQLDSRAGVLWLPPAAFRNFQGQDFVIIEENGVQRRTNVRLGLASDERIEILEGLEEGQLVIGP